MGHVQGVDFDLDTAKGIVDSFSAACGVHCRLYTGDGKLLYEQGGGSDGCAFCRKMTEITGSDIHCEKVHLYGAFQAERFGGRYIYFCPSGMAYFSSPIIVGGAVAGSMVGGPVLIMDIEDYLASDTLPKNHVPQEYFDHFREALSSFPQMEPARLSHLSNLLFAVTVYISDSSHTLFLTQSGQAQQQSINEYIQQLKTLDHVEPYPVEKEQELTSAITQGDKATASRLLNEILGHIFFSTGGRLEVIHARVMELLVVLSRAAVYGGADVEQIFGLNYRYLREVERMNTPEDLALWLANILDRFTALVFDLVDIKHKDVIYKAIDYMKRNYPNKLTLEETAAHINLSPSYFSKVFKEELGCSFNTYLNELRIERSKSILLSGSASIVEICDLVGFEDQSYFTKVFKKITGVTPGRYRERRGRIDPRKERG